MASLASTPRGERGSGTPPVTSENSGSIRVDDTEQPTTLHRETTPQSDRQATAISVAGARGDDAAGPAANSSREAADIEGQVSPRSSPQQMQPSRTGLTERTARSERTERTEYEDYRPDSSRSRRPIDDVDHGPSRNSLSSQDTRDLRGSVASSDSFYFFSVERRLVRKLMGKPQFDAAIGVVIVFNCITIGIEQEFELQGKDTFLLGVFETLFLAIYTFELLARFFGYGYHCIHDNWVKFDTFLVVAGIITGWPLSELIGELDELGPIMVLRTARLMRLARTVRLLIKFRELWMLVRGLLNSASTMLYTLLMVFVIIYIFSCMAVELITNHELARGPNADPEFRAFVDLNFATLPMTMMTLVQFASLDNMNLLYMPLVKKSWWLAIYFVMLILVVSIVLMNLITAVVVNSALEQAMSDKEAMKAQQNRQRKRLMKDLKRMFHSLDDDDSGQVSVDEMALMTEDDKNLLYNVLGVSDPYEVFKQLDVDGSGLLEIGEFCDGIWQVAISNAPIELKRIEKQVNHVKTIVLETESQQQSTKEMLDTILSTLNNHAKKPTTADVADGNEALVRTMSPTSSTVASKSPTSSAHHLPSVLEEAAEGERPGEKQLVESQVLEQTPAWVGVLAEQLRTQLSQETTAMRASLEGTLSQFCALLGSKEFPRRRIVSLGEPAEMMNIPSWALDLKLELLEKAEGLKEGVQDMFLSLNEEFSARENTKISSQADQDLQQSEEVDRSADNRKGNSWTVFSSFWSRREQKPEVAAADSISARAPVDTGCTGSAEFGQAALSTPVVGPSARRRQRDLANAPAWASQIVNDLQQLKSALQLPRETSDLNAPGVASPNLV